MGRPSFDRRRGLVLLGCLASGGLIALSLPPAGFWPLAFAGLAGLAWLLHGVRWQTRFKRGAVTGLALFGPTMVWMKDLTLPGYLVAIFLFAALLGLFLALVPPHAGRFPALVGAWVLAEALRGVWPFGGVPMSILAVGQVAGPLGGIARMGGTLLIAAVTVTAGVALAAATQRRWIPSGIALALVVLAVALSAVAPSGTPTGRRLRVAFVQGGGPQGTRAIDTDERKVFLRHLRASAAVPAGMDLVLWPEDVVDTDGPVQDYREGRELQALAKRLDAPLIVGTVETVDDKRFRNASQVVLPDGRWTDRYDKFHRVPFGEYVPFRSLIAELAPAALPRRDAIIGRKRAYLDVAGTRVAVVISWEVFFGNRARDGVRAGGRLLINPTNGSTYTGTSVQTQQVASSRLRAIETGRWEVQIAPTGFSAFVTPTGRVLDRTSVSERAVRVHDVELRTGQTLYVRWGDDPARLLGVLLVALGWALDRRRRPTGPSPDAHRPHPNTGGDD